MSASRTISKRNKTGVPGVVLDEQNQRYLVQIKVDKMKKRIQKTFSFGIRSGKTPEEAFRSACLFLGECHKQKSQ